MERRRIEYRMSSNSERSVVELKLKWRRIDYGMSSHFIWRLTELNMERRRNHMECFQIPNVMALY